MALLILIPPGLQLLNFADGAFQEVYAEGTTITQERLRALEEKRASKMDEIYGDRFPK